MGLIRSGNTELTVNDDEQLTPYLWAIVKEIIKTAIENGQNLIVEGCYIPFGWQKDFSEEYLKDIRFYCLIMTAEYIEKKFADIIKFENVIERRIESPDKNDLIKENETNLRLCKKYGLKYILIDGDYAADVEL